MSKPPETKHLRLKCDELLSSCAFKFNLRRYDLEQIFPRSTLALVLPTVVGCRV
jgi:hypothetical protein